MDAFPYEPRPGQAEIVRFVSSCVSEGRHAVIESGTGTGKTVCALAGALSALPPGGRVVYLTRTRSQQRQVMAELRAIRGRVPVVGVALQGRSASTCPAMRGDPELAGGTPEELSRLCSELKRRPPEEGGCRFYAAMRDGAGELLGILAEGPPDPEEFQRFCGSRGVCPYEAAKAALPFADVVCAPYPFMALGPVRSRLLEWMGVRLSDVAVIVDEAHNLPDFLRESMTAEYSLKAIGLARAEAEAVGDPEVRPGVSVSDVADAFERVLRGIVRDYLIEDDGLVDPHALQEGMMSELRVPSVSLDRMYAAMADIGEEVREKKRMQRRLPRSHIGAMASFLRFWSGCDDGTYAKVVKGGDSPSLEAYCMDPYDAAEPFRSCMCSVHMSGTLAPLDEYAEELGLTDVRLRRFPSPFDPGNLLSLYVDDVTTRFEDRVRDPEEVPRIEERLVGIVSSERRSTAVFFPSFGLMARFASDGVPERLGRPVLFEERSMSQADLMDTVARFRAAEGGVLFAVVGGRVSEGLDFPGGDLEVAVIVGVPYPFRTMKLDALVRYCGRRFGDGWERAVRTPTVRKMRQARGRLIRSERDRGVCVVLDRRAGSLPGYDALLAADPSASIAGFFGDGP